MTSTLGNTLAAAVAVGFVHTITGPDHYLPFIAMARAGKWSMRRTVVVTLLCGLGHVGSSLVVGLVGIAAGAALFTLNAIEAFRGDVAGWLLLGFGLAYFVWGVRQAIRNRPHTHLHAHADGTVHRHEHRHHDEHAHVHTHEAAHAHAHPREMAHADGEEAKAPSLTPWVLFTIFVFGPCEPLIPLLMIPAAHGDRAGVFAVAAMFSAITLATMVAVVAAAYAGARALPLAPFARYGHAAAGFVILCCGVAIKAGL